MYKGERREEKRAGDKREGGRKGPSVKCLHPTPAGRSPEEGGFHEVARQKFCSNELLFSSLKHNPKS